ncbi:hypothetical protein BC628DRAFT_483035 [Trametes gibbosa]|nr:hypothetical protein BC628DRAFT_483035 [Trametes gibbosa]
MDLYSGPRRTIASDRFVVSRPRIGRQAGGARESPGPDSTRRQQTAGQLACSPPCVPRRDHRLGTSPRLAQSALQSHAAFAHCLLSLVLVSLPLCIRSVASNGGPSGGRQRRRNSRPTPPLWSIADRTGPALCLGISPDTGELLGSCPCRATLSSIQTLLVLIPGPPSNFLPPPFSPFHRQPPSATSRAAPRSVTPPPEEPSKRGHLRPRPHAPSGPPTEASTSGRPPSAGPPSLASCVLQPPLLCSRTLSGPMA